MRSISLAIGAVLASLLPCHAGEITLANWNIQTLVYPGDPKTVFPEDYRREAGDYADLIRWRDNTGAGVFLLQEVSSPAALDAVFPVAEGWTHCISGQYAMAQGLPPGPVCTRPGETAHKPTGDDRFQHTAIAIRPGTAVTLGPIADYQDLNVRSMDGKEERDLRWGLDATLEAGGETLRVLIVHMKSGCFDDQIQRKFWENPPALPPARLACETLGRQLYPLRAWVEARDVAGEKWMLAGDFNRRLDAGSGPYQDEVWRALSGYARAKDGSDLDANRRDIHLFRSPYKEISLCWQGFRNPEPATLGEADDYNILPIEFFIYGRQTLPLVVSGSGAQSVWPNGALTDKKRLSDHCPRTLKVRIGS